MWVLGLSAFYHESACCLLRDGEVVAAAAEERFTRVKHDPRLPVAAFRFCLDQAGIGPHELDAVAYYEQPEHKLARQLWAGPPRADNGDLAWLDPRGPEREIRERLGYEGPLLFFPHHLCHAASAFFFSGYDEAAVLTVDGVGEWATTTYGQASLAENPGGDIQLFEQVCFPHSLGLLYSTITAYLGFRVNGGEYKVMGLAPYGEPRFLDEIFQLVGMGPEGQFALNLPYFDFLQGPHMYSRNLEELMGGPARDPESPIQPRHQHIARSLQLALEEILLEKVGYLHRRVPSEHLVMAGGVALNCVANGRIHRESPFRHLFVQPAAGDSGACLGAAALAHRKLASNPDRTPAMEHVFLGPSFASPSIGELLDATGLAHEDLRDQEALLMQRVAEELDQGRVVGWFQGAMEMGPRALGNRSILADPRPEAMRDRLNHLVKKREGFRPFAPVVREERAGEVFELLWASPFMLETCQVQSEQNLPAITHVDGSARPQTVSPTVAPRLWQLLEVWEQHSGCPVLVNTSFNLRGEPIVCTPVDALLCFARSGLDLVVLQDFLISRDALPANLATLLQAWEGPRRSALSRNTSRGGAISEQLYTFV